MQNNLLDFGQQHNHNGEVMGDASIADEP